MRLVALSALLILSSPSLATEPGNAAPQTSEAKPAKEKKVCKLEEAGSTSRMRKRVCRTVKEWNETKQEGASAADLQRIGAH